jgi:hypothetical protein
MRSWQHGAVVVLVVLGAVFLIAGNLVYYNRQFVIDRLTSRSLGTLAPGYAATQNGIRVYAYLIVSIGLTLVGVGLAPRLPQFGAAGAVGGVIAFVVFSVVAIVGEVRTYRALKR